MPLPIILAGVAGAGLVGEMLVGNGAIDPEELRHRAPEPGRTEYLPVANDGGIDGTNPAEPTSVDALDSKVEEVNASTLDIEPAHLFSYCGHGSCDEGGDCTEVADARELLIAAADAGITEVFDALHTRIESIGATISAHTAEEQIAERLASVYRGEGKIDFDLNRTNRELVETRAAFAEAVSAGSNTANEALATLRLMVQSLRNTLAERAAHRVNAASFAWAVPQMVNPLSAAITGGMTAWDLLQASGAGSAGPEAVQDAARSLETFRTEGADKVQALAEAAKAWTVTPNMASLAGVKVPASESPTPPAPSTPPVSTLPTSSSALPGVGGGAGDTTSEPSLKDALDALMDEPMPEMPPSMMPSGMDSGMGGMPSGGMPSGGMPSGGMPMSDPMAGLGSEPLTDPLTDDELLDDEPLDDVSEDEDDELGDPLNDVTEGEEADVETPEEDAEGEGDVEPTPEAGDVAPVEGDPSVPTVTSDDTTARTVDVGNGRMVTFPSAAMADAVARLVDSVESGGGKTLYLAMSEAGYQLPPLGTDIGEIVPPALLAEGDIVVGQNATGVYLGAGDVLLENGTVVPLSEAAAFGGENQGLFRVAEPEPAEPGLHGPAQPVGDGSTSPLSAPAEPATVSTPGEVIEDVSQPGVPTDTATDDLSATDDTLAGLNMGETDNGAPGLDPGSAFPS